MGDLRMKLHIAMVRHGQSDGERLIGMTDEPLSECGIRIIREKLDAGGYPPAQMVFSSGLSRCVCTAQMIYQAIPVIILKDLRALNFGDFEAVRYDDLHKDERFKNWADCIGVQAYPGGEEPYAMQGRSIAAFGYICNEMANKGIEQAAIITHKSVIQAILRRFHIPRTNYVDWDIPCGGGYLLQYDTVEASAEILTKF